MFVQFLDLPFYGRVHLVEHLGETANFVLAPLGLEFFNVEIAFGDLRNVVNQVVQRLTYNQNLPERHEQNGDDGTVQNNAADMLDR